MPSRWVHEHRFPDRQALAAALAGEIKHFTGIDDPYEEPRAPEITVETDKESIEQSVARIMARLEALSLVASAEVAACGEDDEEEIRRRLEALDTRRRSCPRPAPRNR